MIPTRDLARAAAQALEILQREEDLAEVEVFIAANTSLVSRIHFTSHIPCNGVEEPKSLESIGLGIQGVFRGSDGLRIGFGSEPNDLSAHGVRRALVQSRQSAVLDPEFTSLPHPGTERRRLRRYHDPGVIRLSDRDLVEVGWRVVTRGLEVFARSPVPVRLAFRAPSPALGRAAAVGARGGLPASQPRPADRAAAGRSLTQRAYHRRP